MPGFEKTADKTITDSGGRIGHAAHVANTARFTEGIHSVGDGVWCVTANGLSNQVFIDAPDGIIAIDTGESVEEMRAAIGWLRTVTDRPFAAVMYTHFHYVGGTSAVVADAGRELPIYSHSRLVFNRSRTAGEIAPTYSRGLVEQFGTSLPADGPDGLINIGLGLSYKNPNHAPHTQGFIAPTHTFTDETTLNVAGIVVAATPAPSDADDSVTYWFPALRTAIHNIVWPTIFNVFAIRGEEYRDPRLLLTGLDHLISLDAEHLVPTHGSPMSGAKEIRERVTRYRDSIQFIWDQTVRLTNKGFTGPQLAAAIKLPEIYADDFITTELYGVVEHHVRQVRSGLFGFFDGDEASLFPLDRIEHSDRMISAMGGRTKVRSIVEESMDSDTRWAVELATYLAHSTDAKQRDRDLLADGLRTIAQRTSSANIRNWCLTRARHYDGTADMARYNTHRLSQQALANGDLRRAVEILRVLLDPDRAAGLDVHIAWRFGDGAMTGLHIRNHVACATNGQSAEITVSCELRTWAGILGGKSTLSHEIAAGTLTVSGNRDLFISAMECFDVPTLRQ